MMVKKIIIKISICLAFLFCISSLSFGKSFDPEKIIFREEISVSGMKTSDFLLYLSKEGGIEIVANESLKDKNIEIFCKEGSSLSKVLEILCESNEWMAEKENDYIYISPRVQKEGRGNINGVVSSYEYKKNIEGAKVTLLDGYSKPVYTDEKGRFNIKNIPYGVYFLSVNKKGYDLGAEMIDVNKKDNLIKIFIEENYKNNKIASEKTEDGNNFVMEKVKFSDLEMINIENMIEDSLKEGIKFEKNKEKGMLYISGDKKRVAIIKNYIENLDGSGRQVRITAQIIDVTENLFERLGFSWLYGKNTQNIGNGVSVGILNASELAGIDNIFSSAISFVRNFNGDKDILNLGIDLLQGTQDLTITAVPSIVTTSGKEGIFKITEEKIIGQEKVENDDNGKTTYTPIFREAGIILKVTPEIMKDGSVLMTLELETSDFKMQNYIEDDEVDSDMKGGSKVSRNIKTTLRLKDGDTIFIGGLKKGIVQNSKSEVPFISSIPFLGEFFKHNYKRKEMTDLYIELKIDILKDEDKNKNQDEKAEKEN